MPPRWELIFSPDGNGGFWSNEHVHYDLATECSTPACRTGPLIGPDTILVTDIVRRGGWRVEGVPITVRKKPKKPRGPR
ncbi:MAG: hypothetical protein Ct9H300mP1_35280 [Planctomycetaceae bacterium]|nr:MAG: hypothetical protein Ct9H300mP1_35280 [Planctomycetaceae bacterium]